MARTDVLRAVVTQLRASGGVFVRDVGNGMLEISHNALALLGLTVIGVAVFALGRADVREVVEMQALQWLQQREEVRAEARGDLTQGASEIDALARATATDPKALTRQQALVAAWIARRYKVAPEPVSRLVQEAWEVGRLTGLQPTLILSIMAIESSFNPFAQSPVGAQGLMQVMTRVHNDKYEAFGGNLTAFDPITNLRVGVQVLKECIARAGSLEVGLQHYVGAGNNVGFDGGYAAKVLAEQRFLNAVAAGGSVPVTAPIVVPAVPASTALVPTPAASQPAVAPAAAEERKPDQLALLG